MRTILSQKHTITGTQDKYPFGFSKQVTDHYIVSKTVSRKIFLASKRSESENETQRMERTYSALRHSISWLLFLRILFDVIEREKRTGLMQLLLFH